jgi:hypothetical protein
MSRSLEVDVGAPLLLTRRATRWTTIVSARRLSFTSGQSGMNSS